MMNMICEEDKGPIVVRGNDVRDVLIDRSDIICYTGCRKKIPKSKIQMELCRIFG